MPDATYEPDGDVKDEGTEAGAAQEDDGSEVGDAVAQPGLPPGEVFTPHADPHAKVLNWTAVVDEANAFDDENAIETQVEQPQLPKNEVFSPSDAGGERDQVLDPRPQHDMFIDGMAALASPPAAEPTTKVEQPTLPDEETFTPKPKGPVVTVVDEHANFQEEVHWEGVETQVEQPKLPDEETFTPKPKGPDLPVM